MINKVIILCAFFFMASKNIIAQNKSSLYANIDLFSVKIIKNVNGLKLYAAPNTEAEILTTIKSHEIILFIQDEKNDKKLFSKGGDIPRYWRKVYQGDNFGYVLITAQELYASDKDAYFMNLSANDLAQSCKKMAYTKSYKENQESILLYEDEKGTKVLKSLQAHEPVLILESEKYENASAKQEQILIKIQHENNIAYVYSNELVYAMLVNKKKGLCEDCLKRLTQSK